MKSRTLPLSNWHEKSHAGPGYDLDWPKYHRECGIEKIQYLLSLEKAGKCQLIIENQTDGNLIRLCVEFFDDNNFTNFLCRWD